MTIAAISWHAKAYPATFGRSVVRNAALLVKIWTARRQETCYSVGKHMSYQLLEDSSCVGRTDGQGLLVLSIVGTMFKRPFVTTTLGRTVPIWSLPQRPSCWNFSQPTWTLRACDYTFTLSKNEMLKLTWVVFFRGAAKV